MAEVDGSLPLGETSRRVNNFVPWTTASHALLVG